jgi:hypothetical protein
MRQKMKCCLELSSGFWKGSEAWKEEAQGYEHQQIRDPGGRLERDTCPSADWHHTITKHKPQCLNLTHATIRCTIKEKRLQSLCFIFGKTVSSARIE